MDTDESFPTLTYNVIGRHQSKLVRTRVCSTRSPWLAGTEVGDIYTVPISHGEGRFLASQELIEQLAANGQIATQYAGLDGYATMDTAFNPNGSVCAIVMPPLIRSWIWRQIQRRKHRVHLHV